MTAKNGINMLGVLPKSQGIAHKRRLRKMQGNRVGGKRSSFSLTRFLFQREYHFVLFTVFTLFLFSISYSKSLSIQKSSLFRQSIHVPHSN